MNYHEGLDQMRSMTKTRQDNKVIDRTSVIYAENKTKLF